MSSAKSKQFTVRVTDEMWEQMERLMAREGHRSINEFVRTCIRDYIDRSGDAMNGAQTDSRLESLILWNSLQTQVLIAGGLFTIMQELTPVDAEQKLPSPDVQMRHAHKAGRRLLSQFLEDQASIVDKLAKHQQTQGRHQDQADE